MYPDQDWMRENRCSRSVGYVGKCRGYGAVVKLCAGCGQGTCPWAVHGLSMADWHLSIFSTLYRSV